MITLTEEEKRSIDAMSVYNMLRVWLRAPIGYFKIYDPWSDYFIKSMTEKRLRGHEAWVAARKELSN